MWPWTDTETRVTTIHFASSTTHAKCNNGFNTFILHIFTTDHFGPRRPVSVVWLDVWTITADRNDIGLDIWHVG